MTMQVTFTKSDPPYLPGETAVFEDAAAAALIRRGVAEPTAPAPAPDAQDASPAAEPVPAEAEPAPAEPAPADPAPDARPRRQRG